MAVTVLTSRTRFSPASRRAIHGCEKKGTPLVPGVRSEWTLIDAGDPTDTVNGSDKRVRSGKNIGSLYTLGTWNCSI